MTPKQALKAIKKDPEVILESLEMETGNSEADLIEKFRKDMAKRYPLNDVYHIYSTAYGVQGEADLLVAHSESEKMFLVECKKAYSFKEAIKKLRPDQQARAREYFRVKKPTYLLWWNGWARFEGEWIEGTGSILEAFI